MEKYCSNHLKKKYGLLNNNGSAGKMLTWLCFKRPSTKWVNAIFKIMFKYVFVQCCSGNLNLVSNFRPKGCWILYIVSGVGWPNLKYFWVSWKILYYVIVNLVYSIIEWYKEKMSIWRHLFYKSLYQVNM